MQYIGFKHCHGILRQRNGELPNDGMKCHRQYQFLSNYDVMTSVVIVFYVKEMVQLIFQ